MAKNGRKWGPGRKWGFWGSGGGGVAKKCHSVSGKGDSPVNVDFRDAAALTRLISGSRRKLQARRRFFCDRQAIFASAVAEIFLAGPTKPYVLIY